MKKRIKRELFMFAIAIITVAAVNMIWRQTVEKKQNEAIQRKIEEMNATDDKSETDAPNNSEEADTEEGYTSTIDAEGATILSRIKVPEGFKRTEEDDGSLGQFLRDYPLEPSGSPVLLYDGRKKGGSSAVCVFDMHLGDRDLQQCADSVMRMYAEYMRASGKEDKIAFHFVSGFLCDWLSYKSGKRISVNGNNVSWTNGGSASDSDEAFEGYLETVFNYASTLSLEQESKSIDISDIKIGDNFIKGGSPGHVVMVVDTCVRDGKKAFLLAQGYMPAQQFHVLKNSLHEEDPWYYEDEVTYPFRTPEYTFDEGSLMRPEYLD